MATRKPKKRRWKKRGPDGRIEVLRPHWYKPGDPRSRRWFTSERVRAIRLNEAKPRTTIDVKDIETIPEQYHIMVPAQATRGELIDYLSQSIDFMQGVGALIEQADNVANMEAAGRYVQLAANMVELHTKIVGGGIKPLDAPRLDVSDAKEAKERYSQLLTLALTKMYSGADYANNHGIVDKKGRIRHYMAVGFFSLAGGVKRLIENWVRLLMWEDGQRQEESDYDRQVQHLMGQARSADGAG